ncbi:hypothetical protein [Flavobacterium helocola]|uniref:Uncharacterized protein n=1 Tax=Flavobacterium helocola TaxID=3139139 RepID=A0ABU9I8A4_9FLAO
MELISLISQYNEVNKIFKKVINNDFFVFEDHQFVTDFYNNFCNIIEFDKTILTSITETNNYQVILNSFLNEIEENIIIYKDNKSVFDNYDIQNICNKHNEIYDFEIEYQTRVKKEYEIEYTLAKKAFDGTFYKGYTTEEIDVFRKQYEYTESLYLPEMEKFHELVNKKDALIKFTQKYYKNIFSKIFELSNNYKNTLQKHLQKADENKSNYFNMTLIGNIFEVSNEIVFESSCEIDYYNEFNLVNSFGKLKIIKNQKNKAYYLVHKLYETIDSKRKVAWRIEILNKLGLNLDTYKSKYKEITRDDADETSKDFVKEIDNIFK